MFIEDKHISLYIASKAGYYSGTTDHQVHKSHVYIEFSKCNANYHLNIGMTSFYEVFHIFLFLMIIAGKYLYI